MLTAKVVSSSLPLAALGFGKPVVPAAAKKKGLVSKAADGDAFGDGKTVAQV